MSEPKFNSLNPPPDALEKGGDEVIRAVVVDGGLSISLRRSFDTPSTWGLLLADVARHASRIYAMETGMAESEALEQICDLFEKEMTRPTDLGTTKAVKKN